MTKLDRPVVLQVETKGLKLYPDEDFIATCVQREQGGSVCDWIEKINPADYQQHWKESLNHNGVVCCRGIISPVRIKKHHVFQDIWAAIACGADSCPIPINYMILGARYRAMLELLFEKGEDAVIKSQQEQQSIYDVLQVKKS